MNITEYKPKISIIIPVYKVQEYLERCILSIIQQTYKNLEIILIDDGSPDNCGEICDKYKEQDKRIKVIHKQNEGVSVARNIGIDLATGEYLFFVDSDDYLGENIIDRLYKNLTKYNADISMCNYIRVSDYNTKVSNNEENIKMYSNIQALEKLYKDTFTFHEDYSVFIAPWNKLYKKSMFDNIRYPIGKFYEDGATIYKVLYKANNIVYSDSVLYYYYQRSGSTSRKSFDKTRLDRLDAFKGQMIFYKEKKLDNLYFYAYNTYLNMIIEYYFLSQECNMIEISNDMKNLFSKEFKIAKKELNFSKDRLEELKSFEYPKLYSIKNKIKKEGILIRIKKFITKKICN